MAAQVVGAPGVFTHGGISVSHQRLRSRAIVAGTDLVAAPSVIESRTKTCQIKGRVFHDVTVGAREGATVGSVSSVRRVAN